MKSNGTVTVAKGTPDERELHIVDRLAIKDNGCTIHVIEAEDGSFFISILNDSDTGRNPEQQLWLSSSSMAMLIGACTLYFSAKGRNLGDLVEEIMSDQIEIEHTKNLKILQNE